MKCPVRVRLEPTVCWSIMFDFPPFVKILDEQRTVMVENTCFDLKSIPEFDSLVSRGGENPAVILKDKQRLLLKLKPGVRVERQNSPCVPTKPSNDARRRITLCFDLDDTPALHRLHNNNKYRVYPLNPQQ